MDPLEIDVQATSNKSATPAVFTFNSFCFKVSMKVCPSVKRWTCTGCTSTCTLLCMSSDEADE